MEEEMMAGEGKCGRGVLTIEAVREEVKEEAVGEGSGW